MKTNAMLFLLLALLIASPCIHAKYFEKLSVNTYDKQYREIGGAQAYVEYQLNAIAGFIKTKPVLTNESGFASLSFTNYEEINASTDYSYILYVKYGDQIASQNMIAGNATDQYSKPRLVVFQLDSYYAFVKVHDQFNRPLNATVTVESTMKRVDNVGDAYFQLPPGSYTAKAEYNGVVRNRDFDLGSDQAMDIEIGVYSAEVHVQDDNKRPVAATVEIDGQAMGTDEKGVAKFEKVMTRNPIVVVKYGETYKRLNADLGLQQRMDVNFDVAKPVIRELHGTVTKNGVGTVSLFVEDPGTQPSGIDTVSITYEVSGVEMPVQAYTVGYNTFEAKIPAQPQKTVVKYTAKVADKEGNVATQSGTYVVPENAEPVLPNATNQSGGTGNGGGPILPSFELDTTAIAIYVVVSLIVIYGAFYYLTKRRQKIAGDTVPGGTPPLQPPVQPPQTPPVAKP